jgi:hypothetical protein
MYDPAPCRPYIAAAMNQLAGVPPPRGHPQRILASVAVPASRFPAAFLKRFVSLFLGVGRQVPRYTRLERPSAPIFFLFGASTAERDDASSGRHATVV